MKPKISKKRIPPALEYASSPRRDRVLPRAAQLKRILVPTDFSKPSLKALNYAVCFAEQSGATIILAYALELPTVVHDLETYPLAIPESDLTKSAREKLLTLASSEIEELVPVETHVCKGKAWREIIELARRTNADLIVLATHGRTGLDRMLLGSTAELVVRHAPCPVLVVRDQERQFI